MNPIFSILSFKEPWWQTSFKNLCLDILNSYEKEELSIRDLQKCISEKTNTTIDELKIKLLFQEYIHFSDENSETKYFINPLPDEIKENLFTQKLEVNSLVNEIKQNCGTKISLEPSRIFIEDFFNYILSPIIRRISFIIYKQEYPFLEKLQITQNFNENFKLIINKYNNLKSEMYDIFESLLVLENYGTNFLKRYIHSELFVHLFDFPNINHINHEYFDSKEFQHLVETNFVLSLQIVRSILSLEEHFTKSAESMANILINDNLQKGDLYEHYIKTKFSILQENLEYKLNTFVQEKEKEFSEIVEDFKNFFNAMKQESDTQWQQIKQYFMESEIRFNELYSTSKQNLHEIQRDTRDTLVRLQKENQSYKDELEKLKSNNQRRAEELKQHDYNKTKRKIKNLDESFDEEETILNEKILKMEKENDKHKFPLFNIVYSLLIILSSVSLGYILDFFKNEIMDALSINNLFLFHSFMYVILGLLFLDGAYLVYKNYHQYKGRKSRIKDEIQLLNNELDLKREKYTKKKKYLKDELEEIAESLSEITYS